MALSIRERKTVFLPSSNQERTRKNYVVFAYRYHGGPAAANEVNLNLHQKHEPNCCPWQNKLFERTANWLLWNFHKTLSNFFKVLNIRSSRSTWCQLFTHTTPISRKAFRIFSEQLEIQRWTFVENHAEQWWQTRTIRTPVVARPPFRQQLVETHYLRLGRVPKWTYWQSKKTWW